MVLVKVDRESDSDVFYGVHPQVLRWAGMVHLCGLGLLETAVRLGSVRVGIDKGRIVGLFWITPFAIASQLTALRPHLLRLVVGEPLPDLRLNPQSIFFDQEVI